jgi:WD40 repeat protein
MALFHAPAKHRHFLAKIGLNGGFLHIRPLEPGAGVELAAWAATPAGHWAVGLKDGCLWLLSPGQPAPVLLATPPRAAWSALAFSGDGQTLAAASGRQVRLFKSGRPGSLRFSLAGEVDRLALDQGGHWLWAALTFSKTPNPAPEDNSLPAGRPALALIDLSGPGQPIYQAAEGQVLALGCDQGRALAITEAQPSEGYHKSQGPRAASRWAQGRAELWHFDHLRPAGPAGLSRYDPDRLFAGLTPTELFHQKTAPDRPFVSLGRENLADRRPGRLTATGRQRRLSPAALDVSGRLAVFPELDGYSFHVFNLAAGREIARGRSGDPEGLLGAAFLRDASRLFTFGRGGLVRLWSLKGPEPLPLLTWAFAEGGRWTAVTPEGLFDADDPIELEHALRSVGRNPVLPLSRFAEDSFRPGLSAAVLAPPPAAGDSKPKSK